MHSPPGIFTISLDFELYWGVRDCCSIEAYEANLRGARAAVLQMLDVFGERKIHATWATVGFLFFDELQQLRDHLPSCRPNYRDTNLSPYQYLQKIRDVDPTLHFASDLIDRILQFDGQEVATHTFSHYYCLEPGQTRESFRSDLQSALEVAKRKGVRLESIVFPKNQSNPEYLTVLEELGITSYRGNPPSWVYQSVADSKNTALRRVIRFLDSYCNLTGFHIYFPDDGPAKSLINVPASRFLRPYNRRLAWLEPLRLRRITRAMTAAAESGRLFHLWWHPHNFGVDTAQNLDFLRNILNHYRMLRDRLGMETYNMSEVAQQWERPACPQQS